MLNIIIINNSSSKLKIPLADPLLDDKEVEIISDVVRSGWIREGKYVEQFERKMAKYCNVRNAVTTSSGTAALHVALACLGVKKRDEIILPSFTCIPPVSMTLFMGAIPVFADIEKKTYNINPKNVEKLINSKTKAIIPINYAGHPADLHTLQDIAYDNNIYLLNDGSQALGAVYKGKNVAKIGDATTFSFSPNKTITTGEGGMLVTDNDELSEKARIIKDYGQSKRFHIVELGHNYHMTEMQAAMGLAQLQKIDMILKRKKINAKSLNEKLEKIAGIKTSLELPGYTHVYMLNSIRVKAGMKQRNKLMEKLDAANIQNRVYFPPAHKMPFLQKFKFRSDKLETTAEVTNTILSLPSSPNLSQEDIQYISKTVKKSIVKITQ